MSISEMGTFNDDKEQTFSLPPGDYRALCWTDYISQDYSDWHYDTSKFPEVELKYEKTAAGFMMHNGNTEFRDAYFGTATFNVPKDNKVKIEMRRPMGRFIFEATDLETFAEKHQVEITQQGRNGVETLEGYRAILCYDGYMPSRFNLQANAPSDSRLGAAFNGVLMPATSGSGFIEVGSDLVFSHVDETTVNVIFQLYDEASGELVASTPSIPVPLIRDHVTIVRGKFLSMNVGTGVVIDPSFNGEYNYEYK